MDELVVISKHKCLCQTPISKFDTIINNDTISIASDYDVLEIRINTRKHEAATLELFFELFSILFVCLGAFPVITDVCFNGSAIDTSCWVGKYKTRTNLFRQDLFLTTIDHNSINQQIFDKIKDLQPEVISSFQYLVSEKYKYVISDHRLTLLLHVIDGICDYNQPSIDQLKNEIISRYNVPSGRQNLGKYLAKVYAVSKECFFYYHKKYNCEILRLLRINQYNFLQIVADTRNWNSHFLRNNKPDRLRDGIKITMFFDLIQYMIRLKIAKDIGILINEANVKEYYYVLHDWILDVLYDSDSGLKSKTYQQSKQWNDFIEIVKSPIGHSPPRAPLDFAERV